LLLKRDSAMNQNPKGSAERDEPEALMSVGQVACRYGVAAKTVRNWQYQGRLPFVKLGWLVRFRPADVEALIAKGYHR
jgi:excisionase family DNA binding protein